MFVHEWHFNKHCPNFNKHTLSNYMSILKATGRQNWIITPNRCCCRTEPWLQLLPLDRVMQLLSNLCTLTEVQQPIPECQQCLNRCLDHGLRYMCSAWKKGRAWSNHPKGTLQYFFSDFCTWSLTFFHRLNTLGSFRHLKRKKTKPKRPSSPWRQLFGPVAICVLIYN